MAARYPLPRAVLTFVAAAAGIATLACGEKMAQPTAVVQAPDSADQVLTGFQHFVTRDGIRRSRLEADSAFFYESSQSTGLRRLRVTFFDEKGDTASILNAARGVYRWQDGSMDAEGDVVVNGADGRVLKTQQLRYDDKAKQISTSVPFTLDRAGEHLAGTSFRSDPDFKNVVTARPRGTSDKGILLPGE
jgi:LPS export ABC transporter protein LptC